MRMMLIIKQNFKFIIFLFLFSFLIRSLFFAFYVGRDKNYWNYDTPVYHNVAVSISNGDGISNTDGTPSFYRVPGYSLFLATWYKFFGFDIKNALWLQILFASLIPVLIFLISLILLVGRSSCEGSFSNILLARLVSVFSSFHLGYLLFSGPALTETFFILFFYLFLILFLPKYDLFFCRKIKFEVSLRQMFFAGIFLGLASLFRPVGQYLIFLSVFLLLISNLNFSLKIKNIFSLFFGWLLVVFGWLLRNWLLTGYIFFHTLSGVHFLKHSAARIVTILDNCSYSCALNKLNKEWDEKRNKLEADLGRKISEIENCNLAEQISIKYFKKDLFLTIKHCFINIFKTSFSLYSAELLFMDSGGKLPEYENTRTIKDILFRFLFPKVSTSWIKVVVYLEIIFMFFLWVGIIGFIFKSFFNLNEFCLFAKVSPFIFLFIFISLACGFARLRLPIECFLLILSFKFWLDFLIILRLRFFLKQ